MKNIGNSILGSVTFIWYNDKIKGTRLIKKENGITPIELKDSDLEKISFYSNIMNQLKDGKELYVFVSEYNSRDYDYSEMLYSLEDNIKKENKKVKKLSKLDIYYK